MYLHLELININILVFCPIFICIIYSYIFEIGNFKYSWSPLFPRVSFFSFPHKDEQSMRFAYAPSVHV